VIRRRDGPGEVWGRVSANDRCSACLALSGRCLKQVGRRKPGQDARDLPQPALAAVAENSVGGGASDSRHQSRSQLGRFKRKPIWNEPVDLRTTPVRAFQGVERPSKRREGSGARASHNRIRTGVCLSQSPACPGDPAAIVRTRCAVVARFSAGRPPDGGRGAPATTDSRSRFSNHDHAGAAAGRTTQRDSEIAGTNKGGAPAARPPGLHRPWARRQTGGTRSRDDGDAARRAVDQAGGPLGSAKPIR